MHIKQGNNITTTKHLFTDGSVNPQSKIGYGVYLLLDTLTFSQDLKKECKIKKFINTSSTKLELETLLFAFEEISPNHHPLIIYTDCQNILSLKERREKLEKNNYQNSKGTLIANHTLYQSFFKWVDIYNCTFIKIKGHKQKDLKDDVDKIFSLVDMRAREGLRES